MDSKMKPVAIVHCIFMAIVFVSLFFVGAGVIKNLIGSFAPTLLLRLGVHFFCLLGIVMSALYIFKGYRKQAAGFYKAFMCVTSVAILIQAILQFLPQGESGKESLQFDAFHIFIIILVMLASIGFVILAFAKDLGSKKTWILYTVVIVAYIAFSAISLLAGRFVISKFFAQFGPLLLIGSTGFMIKGKFDDKAKRGKAA